MSFILLSLSAISLVINFDSPDRNFFFLCLLALLFCFVFALFFFFLFTEFAETGRNISLVELVGSQQSHENFFL